MSKLEIHRLSEHAKLPVRASNAAACFDLSLCCENYPFTNSVKINPHQTVVVGTGLVFNIPEGYHLKVYGRSGNAAKLGLMLANGVGIIDSDYGDELKVILYNSSDKIVILNHGDRIAQFEVVEDNTHWSMEEINERPEHKGNRTGGLGSTGLNH